MIADWIIDGFEKLGKWLWNLIKEAFSDDKKPVSKVDADLVQKLQSLQKADTTAKPAQQISQSQSTPTQSSQTSLVQSTQPAQVVQTTQEVAPVQTQTHHSNTVVYHIKPFKDNENGTAYRQGFLKSFMDLSQSVQYVITGNRDDIKLFAIMPIDIGVYFENIFYASFPTSELVKITLYTPPASQYWISYNEKNVLTTDKDFMKEGTYIDPLKDVFGVFDTVDSGQVFTISYTYTFKKTISGWAKFIARVSNIWNNIFSKKKEESAEEKKDEKPEDVLKCFISIGCHYTTKDAHIQQGMKLTIKGVYSKFLHAGGVVLTPEKKSSTMTLAQVVNFFHMPIKSYEIHALDYAVYRKLPYPISLPTPDKVEKNAMTLLGKTDYRGQETRFGIKDEDSFRHLYIVGKTGTGKSTFLSNIIKSHMYTNKGLCVIDPHGDLVDTVMEHVPSWRTNDVILFDVGDGNNPIGFNLLQYNNEEEKNLIVSGVVATFKKLFGNSWGPRLEYVLRNVMLSVVEYPNATIMHVMRVLTDKNFREEVLENVTDPIVLKFWRTEFDKWSDSQRNEAIAPITNKVGQFLSSPVVRNIFGQPTSKLNLRKVMDEGKILLVNLSKGKIGEDNTEMIGSFIVTKLQIDAMSRTDIPELQRRPFYLHIDEFQNFATDSFAVILSEARKYRLALIVANQYTSQLTETIRDAIFGNIGTVVSFNIGFDDAVIMAQQFKSLITPNDLISLPRFRAYIRLMVDGIMSNPFSMSTLPLSQPELSGEIKDKIRLQSRQRYAMERSKLEDLIKIWANKTFSPVEKAIEKAKMDSYVDAVADTKVKDKDGFLDGTSFTPGVEEKKSTTQAQQVNEVGIPVVEKKLFTLDDLQLGEWYDGIVKLKYNYGLFVIIKGIDGLLHKNFIKVPDGISWKDVYNIGDKIRVKAHEFKVINGEKRIVWTQL